MSDDPTHRSRLGTSDLGDGVYVQLSCCRDEMMLTTENGISETNRVSLGPAETAALLLWLKQRNDEVPE